MGVRTRSGLKSSCTRAEEKDLGVVEEGFTGLGLFRSDTETRRNLNHSETKAVVSFPEFHYDTAPKVSAE